MPNLHKLVGEFFVMFHSVLCYSLQFHCNCILDDIQFRMLTDYMQ